MPRIRLLILIFLVLIFTTGCWGSTETDEVAYVLAMGFDQGQKKNMLITVSIANPKVIAGMAGGSGDGGTGEKPIETISVEADAPLIAFNLLNTSINRRLSLLHTKVYVFSEELAKKGLSEYVLPLNRYREFRGTSFVFITKGKAKDLLEKNNPQLELSPSKQFELIGKTSELTNFFPNVKFLDFYTSLKSHAISPFMPTVALQKDGLSTVKPGLKEDGDVQPGEYMAGEVPLTGSSKIQVIGTAVFQGDKMVGTLNGNETRYFQMLRGEWGDGIITIVDPEKPDIYVGLRVHQARKPEYKTKVDENGKVTIDVGLFFEPEIVNIPSGIHYEDPDKKPILEKAFEEEVKDRCLEVIRLTQEDYQADPVGFGMKVKHNFWLQKDWEDYHWLSRYPEADIHVSVNARIRRTGLQVETEPIVGR